MPYSCPLWLCFVFAVLAFTGAFTSSLWTTLNRAAVSSVADISAVAQTTIMYDLEHRLQSLLDVQMLLLNSWRAIPRVSGSTPEDVAAYTYGVMSRLSAVEAMSLSRPNGEWMGASVLPDGSVGVTYRGPSALGALVNMTTWGRNGSFGTTFGATTFDARQRPWYNDAIEASVPVFTYSFRSALTTTELISLSAAIRNVNGSVAAVLMVTFPFAALTSQLLTAQKELRSSGMLILMEQMTRKTIASATASPVTLEADITEVQEKLQGNLLSHDVQHMHFRTFGEAVVLQVILSTENTMGLKWKLVVVLPDSDYYAEIQRQNVVAGAEACAILAVFLVALVMMINFLVTRPLRALTRHIDQLRQTLSYGGRNAEASVASNDLTQISPVGPPLIESSPFTDLRATTDGSQGLGSSSRFTEVRALYRSVVAALAAASEVSLQRARDATQTAELKRAEEHTQFLMKAKESFFAVMSHEMRTPLTACIGMAEVLRGFGVYTLRSMNDGC